jgi:hypothetical protein
VLYETPVCWDNFLMDFFGLWRMRSEISNSFFSVSIDGLPDLIGSHTKEFSWNFWTNCRSALRCGTLVSGNFAWNFCWTCVYSPLHRNTAEQLGTYAFLQITLLSQKKSFLLHCLAQSDCLAGDRQGQVDTRITLTPSVITNSNYIIIVSDWNCLKYFCVFFVL